jgi:hypothetical protein
VRLRFASILLLGVGLALAACSQGDAELTVRGDLFVSFKGGIAPNALPRDEPAPISISFSGKVGSPPGSHPPPLRQIGIAINRNGHLDNHGLPTCPLSDLEGSTPAQALDFCRRALVGSGSYAAASSFPEEETFPADGGLLAFNGKREGLSVIFVQVHGDRPTPATSVITFFIRHPAGGYGTVLNGVLPPALSHYGYVKRISLSLHRRFSYRGRIRSFLSAACAAPAGVPIATFAFARASMRFEGGATLSSALTRTCRVRN